MRSSLLAFTFFILTISALAQTKGPKTPVAKYDSVLAKKLGADKYGMKSYVMAFLRTGKTTMTDSLKAMELQKAHLKNIMRLADEGKLVVAGPFMDGQSIEAIFIFNVSSVEEARKLTESDPAVKAGVLDLELHPWYGSAALMQVVGIHKTIEKTSVADF